MQRAAITVNDGSAAPVAITFTPTEVTPSKTVFTDRRKASVALQPTIEVGYSAPSASRPTARPSYAVIYPIEGLVNGVAAPVGVARYESGKCVEPADMSLTDKKHFHAFIANGLNVPMIKAVFVDNEPIY